MHAELAVGSEVYSMIEDAYMASGEIDKHQFCEDYIGVRTIFGPNVERC